MHPKTSYYDLALIKVAYVSKAGPSASLLRFASSLEVASTISTISIAHTRKLLPFRFAKARRNSAVNGRELLLNIVNGFVK